MQKVVRDIDKNLENMESLLEGCDDIKHRNMRLGKKVALKACIYYVEVAVNNLTIEESVIGKLLTKLMDLEPEQQYEFLRENALGITDVNELETLEEAIMGIMVGDGVLFLDGYDRAIKIKSKGYPFMGVTQSDVEKVMRGSKEGFSDSVKCNTALIRKRIRNSQLKVKEKVLGRESNTTVACVYMENKARKSVLKEIDERLDKLPLSGIFDSGMIEKMTGEKGRSLFPAYQTTERPDTAAMAIMEGRVVLISDNSPVALIFPSNLRHFFQAPDDYYTPTKFVSFIRCLRYIAGFLSMCLPALYLSLVSFHTELFPPDFIFSMAAARQKIPYSPLVEMLFMELAFELIREAGIRIPGPVGSAMGIVGGLIIGQAAVNAALASPIVVIVVALTALSSFAIPNEQLVFSLRLMKYIMLFGAAWLGLYGIFLKLSVLVVYLSAKKSFGFPYLLPVVSDEINQFRDKQDYSLKEEQSIYQKKQQS